MRGASRYLEDLIRSRRPRRFRAREDDTAMIRTAITLRAARPGSGEPAEEFVTALHKRLTAELRPPALRGPAGARRTLLRAATVAGMAVAAGAAGAGVDHVLTSRTGPVSLPTVSGTLTPSNGIWLTVAASTDLPDGAVRPFTAGAVTGYIERADGELRAVSGICTHQGCRLNLIAHPARLACPCHGATFALDGAVLSHRFPVPIAALPRIEVREASGIVQVYTPAPLPCSGWEAVAGDCIAGRPTPPSQRDNAPETKRAWWCQVFAEPQPPEQPDPGLSASVTRPSNKPAYVK